MSWYKLTRPDGWDFRTGATINYADNLGATVVCDDYRHDHYCGNGLHISQDPSACFAGAEIPCRAFLVEPVHGLIIIDEEKSKCQELFIREEIQDLDTLFRFDYTGLVRFLDALRHVPALRPEKPLPTEWSMWTPTKLYVRFGHPKHQQVLHMMYRMVEGILMDMFAHMPKAWVEETGDMVMNSGCDVVNTFLFTPSATDPDLAIYRAEFLRKLARLQGDS